MPPSFPAAIYSGPASHLPSQALEAPSLPEMNPANNVYAQMREPLPLEQTKHVDGESSEFRGRRHFSSRCVSDTRRRSASCIRKHLESVTSEHDVHVETKVYRGVRMRSWGKWVSEIRQPKKRSRIWLGSYSTPEAAAKAYDMALYYLRGPLAALNFPASIPSEDPPADLSPRTVQKAAIRAGQAADREQVSGNHKEVELRESSTEDAAGLHGTMDVLDKYFLQVNPCELQASATVSSQWDLATSPTAGLRVRRQQVSRAAGAAVVFESLAFAKTADQVQRDQLTGHEAMRPLQTATSAGIRCSTSSAHEQSSSRRSGIPSSSPRSGIPADRSRPRRVLINLNEKAPPESSSSSSSDDDDDEESS